MAPKVGKVRVLSVVIFLDGDDTFLTRVELDRTQHDGVKRRNSWNR